MNDEAILEMEKAISRDPKNQGYRSIITSYYFAGEYENAIEAGNRFEQSPFILLFQGLAYFNLGKNKEALENFNRIISIDPDTRPAISSSLVKAFIEGDIQEGLSYAAKYEQYDFTDAEAWYFISFLYGLLGDAEGCVRCLRKAVDGGFFNYPLMSRDPNLDQIRDNPEFRQILETAREKHAAFKEKFFL
jgi:tetratricopeptide (TPR) repeat protein